MLEEGGAVFIGHTARASINVCDVQPPTENELQQFFEHPNNAVLGPLEGDNAVVDENHFSKLEECFQHFP